MTTARQQEILSNIDDSMRSNFLILANYFKADGGTLEHGLKELIPDIILRPFLTPTSGVTIPQEQDYAVLRHDGILEFILRCNLREFSEARSMRLISMLLSSTRTMSIMPILPSSRQPKAR